MGRLIDADKLKAHYAWWKGGTREMTMDEAKSDFDCIIDLQPTVEVKEEPNGMYKCFHCGGTVCWDSDFDFEDFGYEGEGIVHICHCMECGAEIEYDVPIGENNDA